MMSGQTTKIKTPISDFEMELARTCARATFPIGSGPKRFIHGIVDGHLKNITERGRWYLAFVAHRFRRQYLLSAEQWAWVNEQLSKGTANDRNPDRTSASNVAHSSSAGGADAARGAADNLLLPL